MTLQTLDIAGASPLGEVSNDGDSLSVVFRRRYAKPIEKVWAAVTIPERLADWLFEISYDRLASGARLRLGSKWESRIVACEPPRLFSWAWELDGRETLVSFVLEPDGDACILTLTHSGLSPRAGQGAGVRAGWHAHLEALPDAMEGRATSWDTKTAREAAVQPHYPPLPR